MRGDEAIVLRALLQGHIAAQDVLLARQGQVEKLSNTTGMVVRK
jgi:hypothetical protein